MVDSGLSVVRSLGILAGQVENKELARVLGEVRLDVERGSSLSAAWPSTRRSSPSSSCTMVQAGEVGGNLDDVLLDLAATMEKQAAAEPDDPVGHDLSGRGAVGDGASSSLAMMIFIVPVFQKLFKSLGGQAAAADPDR